MAATRFAPPLSIVSGHSQNTRRSHFISNACLSCRRVKMKCCVVQGSICERCRRKSLECVFRQHRRGRQRTTKLKNIATPRAIDKGSIEQSVSPPNEATATTQGAYSKGTIINSEIPSVSQLKINQEGWPLCRKGSDRSRHQSRRNSGSSTDPTLRDDRVVYARFWTDSKDFHPPALLNNQAVTGQFSLQNVLSTSREAAEPVNVSSLEHSLDDPVQLGLVNFNIANSLYERWVTN